jgi:hypothetical protein
MEALSWREVLKSFSTTQRSKKHIWVVNARKEKFWPKGPDIQCENK